MPGTICIFEDPQYVKLLPLVYTRPVYDLRCGILTLREKIQRAYPAAETALLCRPYLADVVKQQHTSLRVNNVDAGECLFVNGRLLATKDLAKKIPLRGSNAVFIANNTVVAVRSHGNAHQSGSKDFSDEFDVEHFSDFEKIDVDVEMIEYPWNLVAKNGEQITSDFLSLMSKIKGNKIRGKVYPGAHLLNKRQIFIDTAAIVKPGVVLDAEGGPIFIGKNAKIFPNAVIEGPAYIGMNSLIKIGAKIYENTSIGEMCKVGGEVEACILHSFSNKQHDGFLGHSYLGMWCNLGADTNNSDLKNNYGRVKVYVNGSQVDSGSQFVGLTMGDHSKSGINTMFNTGTVVGVSSNVFGAGFPPKFVPSFSWGSAEKLDTYDVGKALDVARRVMARRKVEMSAADEQLIARVFELTKRERS